MNSAYNSENDEEWAKVQIDVKVPNPSEFSDDNFDLQSE